MTEIHSPSGLIHTEHDEASALVFPLRMGTLFVVIGAVVSALTAYHAASDGLAGLAAFQAFACYCTLRLAGRVWRGASVLKALSEKTQ